MTEYFVYQRAHFPNGHDPLTAKWFLAECLTLDNKSWQREIAIFKSMYRAASIAARVDALRTMPNPQGFSYEVIVVDRSFGTIMDSSFEETCASAITHRFHPGGTQIVHFAHLQSGDERIGELFFHNGLVYLVSQELARSLCHPALMALNIPTLYEGTDAYLALVRSYTGLFRFIGDHQEPFFQSLLRAKYRK